LKCQACPTAKGVIGKSCVGSKFLEFQAFKRILDNNLWLKNIEISNWGEIFLNPDILSIMKYGYEKKVSLTARNGVNLNRIDEDVLEGLVKYQFKYLSVSIDGATPKTYSAYRKAGDYLQVIQNIKRINFYKNKYGSKLPHLRWQFVLFEHNKHELYIASDIARKLNMKFHIKLSWDKKLAAKKNKPRTDSSKYKTAHIGMHELLGSEDSLIRNSKEANQFIRTNDKKSSIISDLERSQKQIYKTVCMQLWLSPQINCDGKILGCCINYWNNYGNVFDFPDLLTALNNEKMTYARRMSAGQVPPIKDIPCASCHRYKIRRKEKNWIMLSDLLCASTDLTGNLTLPEESF
jgi:MoaA/NifB/PqqE/SkfB family radical SAM enzyme